MTKFFKKIISVQSYRSRLFVNILIVKRVKKHFCLLVALNIARYQTLPVDGKYNFVLIEKLCAGCASDSSSHSCGTSCAEAYLVPTDITKEDFKKENTVLTHIKHLKCKQIYGGQ